MLQGETPALKIFDYFTRRWRTEELFRAYLLTHSASVSTSYLWAGREGAILEKAEQEYS